MMERIVYRTRVCDYRKPEKKGSAWMLRSGQTVTGTNLHAISHAYKTKLF